MKSIYVIVHRIHFGNGAKAGGIDQIISFLQKKGKNFVLIEHPLTSSGKTKVLFGDFQNKIFIPFSGSLRWIIEYFFNLIFLIKNHKKIDLIIAVDPLNFLSAFSYSFFSGKRVMFHIPDFSENRFRNQILNKIYQSVMRIACKLSTETTCVSKPMENQILKWGVKKNNLTLIPNSPALATIPTRCDPISNPVRLVFTKSEISHEEINFLLLIIQNLNIIQLPFILTVIGKLPSDFNKPNESNLKFTGLIALEKNFSILKESDIGLAIYLKPTSFEKFADSLKIREYAAFSLPIISTPDISTALEGQIANCVLLSSNAYDFVECILKLTQSSILYRDMAKNARSWAESNDKDKILDGFFSSKFDIV